MLAHEGAVRDVSTQPFAFVLALETFGHARVAGHVGVEPSGDAFNAISLWQRASGCTRSTV